MKVASLLTCAALLVAAPVASAERDDDAVLLARVFVAEAGWEAHSEHAALAHVLARRAANRGMRLGAMACAYSRNVCREGAQRPWIASLNAAGNRPNHWDSHVRVSWAPYRAKWMAALNSARAFLRGELTDPCVGAEHWGARYGIDRERARRAGWVEVVCVDRMQNAFWRRPGR